MSCHVCETFDDPATVSMTWVAFAPWPVQDNVAIVCMGNEVVLLELAHGSSANVVAFHQQL